MIGFDCVGRACGASLADFGRGVLGVSKDTSKTETLEAGRNPILEPRLDKVIADIVRRGSLSFTTDLARAMAPTNAVFTALDMPSRCGAGFPDRSYLYAAAREIGSDLSG